MTDRLSLYGNQELKRPYPDDRGLALAEAREQRFLRGGNRDVVAPLEVRA